MRRLRMRTSCPPAVRETPDDDLRPRSFSLAAVICLGRRTGLVGLGSPLEYSGLGGNFDLERRRLRPPVRPEWRIGAEGASSMTMSASSSTLGRRASVRSSSSTWRRLRFLSVDLRSGFSRP